MPSVCTTSKEWLLANAPERMDANRDCFPDDRRAFHLARYDFASERVAGLRVADIACGTGYGCAILANQAAEVMGCDVNSETIAYAKAKYGDRAKFYCSRAHVTGWESGIFGAITSFETLEHVPDDSAVVAEFARLLKPGGLLIASVPNNWGTNKYHLRNYTPDSLRALLEPLFDVQCFWSQNSGTDYMFNHGQRAGITPMINGGDTAECLIVEAMKK